MIAENLAGSEANFARYMTWKARQLGMQHSWYQNASGLPDPSQRTTARDIARLALALYHDFPREYRYFSTQEFYFRGDQINTHNHLLEWYPGADGIKTGFVNASGFNIATSAVRNGRRLIGVIMGGRSAHSRDVQMASLLDQGFAALGNRQPAQPVRRGGDPRTYREGTARRFDRSFAAGAQAIIGARRARPARGAPRLAAAAAIAAAEAADARGTTRRTTTKATPRTAKPARCAASPAPRCGIWRRCRKRRPRPPFKSRRQRMTAGASSSAPSATSRRRARRCAESSASRP